MHIQTTVEYIKKVFILNSHIEVFNFKSVVFLLIFDICMIIHIYIFFLFFLFNKKFIWKSDL